MTPGYPFLMRLDVQSVVSETLPVQMRKMSPADSELSTIMSIVRH